MENISSYSPQDAGKSVLRDSFTPEYVTKIYLATKWDFKMLASKGCNNY